MKNNNFNYIDRLSDFDAERVKATLIDAIDGAVNIGLCMRPRLWAATCNSELNTFENLSPEACLVLLREFQAILAKPDSRPKSFALQEINLKSGAVLVPSPLLKDRAERALSQKEPLSIEEYEADASFKLLSINFWLDDLFIDRAPAETRPLDQRSETTYLHIIAALLDAVQREGVFSGYNHKNETQLIKLISEKYAGIRGCSKRTLEDKFKEARNSLE